VKKIFAIFSILILILFTAIIKNSTKRIDDEIFVIKENIRSLKKDYENTKLEYDYLSSAEKLLKFQDLYFEDKLVKKKIIEIIVIEENSENFEILGLNLNNE
tara:strand:- start:1615 stop:1920 length:306 start_codon:yes stop_codon:yes gene_type:complete